MDLHPDFPVVDGPVRVAPAWVVTIPQPMNRRFEDGSIVFWRPGFTAWITVWDPKTGESPDARLKWIRDSASKGAYEQKETNLGGTAHFSYRLKEPTEGANDKRVPALYCYAVGLRGDHVQMAVYFDTEKDAPKANALCASIKEET